MEELIKDFHVCQTCGKALWEDKKKKFFVCPKCGCALCKEEELGNFEQKYCGFCGTELASAKKEAMALAEKLQNKKIYSPCSITKATVGLGNLREGR